MVICKHAEICSGCPWIEKDFLQQQNLKQENFWKAWDLAFSKRPERFQFHSLGPSGLRDRVDLVLEKGHLGFYEKTKKKIFDVDHCPQMSAGLDQVFQSFKKFKIPVQKGSLRLRVSPSGKKGLWLDFANLDIKQLMDEKSLLLELMQEFTVEVGQRRKNLANSEGKLKLVEDVFEIWTETYSQNKSIPLFGKIGSFTQTGLAANKLMTGIVEGFLTENSLKILEYGSGIGTFTFPLLAKNNSVDVVESEKLSLQALDLSLKNQGKSIELGPRSFEHYDVLFLNPPRSGVGNFLAPLKDKSQKMEQVFYVSCYLESFLKDALTLKDSGYQINQIHLVDQFPQSPHFEILTEWK